MKKMLEKLIKEVRSGYYDAWAEGYIEDAGGVWAEINDALNPVLDFLESRLIETEDGEKCPSGHKQDADGRCKCVNKDAY